MDRGDIGYAVLVYPAPPSVTGSDQSILEQTIDNMKTMMAQRGADMKIVEKSAVTECGNDVFALTFTKRSGIHEG